MVGSLPQVSGSLSSVSSDLSPRKRLRTIRRPMVCLSCFIGPFKASLMVSSDNASGNWVEELPAVLLGLRSTVKEGLGTSAAEAVYGEPLRLPGSLVSTPTDPPSPGFVDDVRHLAYGLSFIPAIRHGSEGFSRNFEALRAASHILVRQDHVPPPLTQPYKGPYRVIGRSRDYFTLDLDGREDSISMSRFIPCRLLTETDSPSPTTTRPVNPRLKPNLWSPTSLPMTLKKVRYSHTKLSTSTRSGRVVKIPVKLNL